MGSGKSGGLWEGSAMLAVGTCPWRVERWRVLAGPLESLVPRMLAGDSAGVLGELGG